MSLQENYLFWRLTNYFLGQESYRLIHLHEEKQELWLENPNQKSRPVIRIQMRELGWANVLERDIQHTFHISENLRKQMGKMKLVMMNIYISPFEPVGDVQPFFDQEITSKNNKIHLRNELITAEDSVPQLQHLEKELKIETGTFEIPKEVTEETVAFEREAVITYITKKVNEEQKNARKDKPIVTYIFIALQTLATLFVFFQDKSLDVATLIKWGAKYNPLIYEGEWYRFITPMFLHSGLLHLLSNCLMLYIVGPWAERAYGKWRYILILLGGGIAGTIAGFAFNSESAAIGSSTAVFAVFGALLYLVVLKPHVYSRSIGTSILALVVVNLVLDLFMPNVGVDGHIGGLVGGFFIAASLSLPSQYIHWRQFIYGSGLVFLSALFLFMGYNQANKPINPMGVNALTQLYFYDKQPKEANKLLTYLVKSRSADEYTYLFIATNAFENKNYRKAETAANEAISIADKLPQPHYILSLCKLRQGDKKAALKEAQNALQISDREIYRKYYEDLKNNKENRGSSNGFSL